MRSVCDTYEKERSWAKEGSCKDCTDVTSIKKKRKKTPNSFVSTTDEVPNYKRDHGNTQGGATKASRNAVARCVS